MRHRGRFLNQDVERGSGDQFATVSANLPSTTPANASPAQAAAQSNPHRRPTTHQPPRVLSSEAFGRRPPTRLYRSTTGRHPKPFAEMQARIDALEEEVSAARERAAATTEILGVINSTPGNLAPVFDVILKKALHLCEAAYGTMHAGTERRSPIVALRGVPPALVEVFRERELFKPKPGNVVALAAKSATSTIPIVFISTDAVEAGLVASLARPGDNLTGISLFAVELVAKRLELMSELVPRPGVIALLVNPKGATTERIIREVGEVQYAARTKGCTSIF